MATAQAAVIRKEVGSLLLYTPVVHPQEFDVAIAYLVRRLEEGASQENFMSAVFDIGKDPVLFDRERRPLPGVGRRHPDGGPEHQTGYRTATSRSRRRDATALRTPPTPTRRSPPTARWARAIQRRMHDLPAGDRDR